VLIALGQNVFIFGESFLGEDRARQIEFSKRPARLAASAPQKGNDLIDLFIGQSLFPGWHDLGEPSYRAAFVNDRIPVRRAFARAAVAVREIRKCCRRLESDNRQILTDSVRAMTTDAGGLEDFFSGIQLQTLRRSLLRRRRLRLRDKQYRQANREEKQYNQPRSKNHAGEDTSNFPNNVQPNNGAGFTKEMEIILKRDSMGFQA
jgi:hypothetical protein